MITRLPQTGLLLADSQGGIYSLTTNSTWETIPLPITANPFCAVGIGWTDATNFSVRCHDNIVDAAVRSLSGMNNQNLSYVVFSK